MGDVGDYWNDHREYKREKSKQQMKLLPNWLKSLSDAGLIYMDMGGFYRINNCFDWWPSTGTWMSLDKKVRDHGVRNLIKHITERK